MDKIKLTDEQLVRQNQILDEMAKFVDKTSGDDDDDDNNDNDNDIVDQINHINQLGKELLNILREGPLPKMDE